MSRSNRSAKVALVIFVCLLMLMRSSTAEELENNQVKIGVIIPLTGPLAASAESFRAASLMALEDFSNGAPTYSLRS